MQRVIERSPAGPDAPRASRSRGQQSRWPEHRLWAWARVQTAPSPLPCLQAARGSGSGGGGGGGPGVDKIRRRSARIDRFCASAAYIFWQTRRVQDKDRWLLTFRRTGMRGGIPKYTESFESWKGCQQKHRELAAFSRDRRREEPGRTALRSPILFRWSNAPFRSWWHRPPNCLPCLPCCGPLRWAMLCRQEPVLRPSVYAATCMPHRGIAHAPKLHHFGGVHASALR